MHQCLTIVELQRLILREVLFVDRSDPKKPKGGPTTLAQLARTCRTLSNTALDILWEDLPSIAYLIQCLPSNLWHIDQTSREMSFKRPMSLSDWEIFFRYSSRVRYLSAFSYANDWSCKSLGSDVIFALSRPPHDSPLVPHFETLRWGDPNKKYEPILQLLLTHSLIDITLPYFALCSPTMSIQLSSRCPSLRRLCVAGFELHDLLPGTVSCRITLETILGLPRSLESLNCSTLDEAAIVQLSRFSSLTSLALEVQDDLQLENLRHLLTPSAFGSLESLSLSADMLSSLTSFLDLMRIKPRRVRFLAKEPPTPDMFHLFSTVLVQACDPNQLSRINVSINDNDDESRQEISLSTLQPLLAFPNMEHFSLDAFCNLSLDDDAMTVLANHWPKLTYLTLNPSFGWGAKSRVTHRGLIALLSGCVQLEEFLLAVDFSEIDHPHFQLPMSGPGNRITSSCRAARFIESNINHPTSIVAFLGNIFPQLREVDSCWYDVMDMMDNGPWTKVRDLLLTLHSLKV